MKKIILKSCWDNSECFYLKMVLVLGEQDRKYTCI